MGRTPQHVARAMCVTFGLAAAWSTSVKAQEPAPPAPPAAPAPPPAPVPTLSAEKYRLDNGLEVVLHQDARRPQVTVNVTYHVGAFDERRGQSGLAHLVERLMAHGSAHVQPEQHAKLLEEVGAAVVASETGYDRTSFIETVPRHEVELALWLEADRMGFLLEAMNPQKLTAQKTAAKSARAARIDAVPYGLAREALWQKVIPFDHPYHGRIVGSAADLARVSDGDLRAFYDDGYAPANATLAIVGDFDTTEIKKLVDKYFRTLPTWPKLERQRVTSPVINGEVLVNFDEPIGALPYVELIWLVPARGQPGELDLAVLAHVLGDGIDSKLQEALLVVTEQAEHVDVSLTSLANVSAFRIGAVVRPGVAPTDVKETIQAQLNFLTEIPVSPEEVARAKKKMQTELMMRAETGHGRADVLQEANHYDGDPAAFARRAAALEAVTDASVMASLSWLPKERRGVLIATPKPKETAPAAEPAKEAK